MDSGKGQFYESARDRVDGFTPCNTFSVHVDEAARDETDEMSIHVEFRKPRCIGNLLLRSSPLRSDKGDQTDSLLICEGGQDAEVRRSWRLGAVRRNPAVHFLAKGLSQYMKDLHDLLVRIIRDRTVQTVTSCARAVNEAANVFELCEVSACGRLADADRIGDLSDGNTFFLWGTHNLSQDVDPLFVREFFADFPECSFAHV